MFKRLFRGPAKAGPDPHRVNDIRRSLSGDIVSDYRRSDDPASRAWEAFSAAGPIFKQF